MEYGTVHKSPFFFLFFPQRKVPNGGACRPAGRSMTSSTTCPVDATNTGFLSTPTSLDDSPRSLTCPELAQFCSTHTELFCEIANLCPVTCGACSTRFFCDLPDPGFTLNGETATCPQLAAFCNDATYGSQIKYLCPETCSCGHCPPSPPPMPPFAPGCEAAIDVVLVLDQSASVRGHAAEVAAFALEAASQFRLSGAETRVGIIGVDPAPRIVTDLTASAAEVREGIGALTRQVGIANISAGLILANSMLSGGARGGIARQVVLLTDTAEAQAADAALALKRQGVGVIAIGWGDARLEDLEAIASTPSSLFAFSAATIASARGPPPPSRPARSNACMPFLPLLASPCSA